MAQHRPAWQICLAALSLILVLVACNNQTPTSTPMPTSPPIGATAIATSASSLSDSPTGLTAVMQDTVIKLTWQAVPSAVGYFVYRDGNEGPLNLKPVAETTFTDIGLTNGRTYTYTVAASDAANQPGPPSAPISAVPASK